MNLLVAAIGKLKASPEKTLCEKYQRQCGWPIALHEFESKKKDARPRIAEEGKWLLNATDASHSKRILLDERGKTLSSSAFSAMLGTWEDDGIRQVSFLIGGADGHCDTVRQSADLTLAFGPMTWPHMLARAMLTEQLYRAWSIRQGHPYHRE